MAAYKLVVSDVDGTLVTHDKLLTERTVATVRRLRQQGIGFTVTSSRPPIGLRMLVEPLGLTLPMGAFNGSAMIAPDMVVVEQHAVPEAAARLAVETLRRFGVGVWVFAQGQWLVTDPAGDYVDRESHTLQSGPTTVEDLAPFLGDVGKIVGASRDFQALAACEVDLRVLLKGEAAAARSQPYYLDVTPPGLDKGTFVSALSRRLAIDPQEIVTIGDMDNDIPMFRASGFSIAMGNGSEGAKAAAGGETTRNDDDGFAEAMERYVLG